MTTTTLYRPIGIGEYRLIQESGYRSFPPRLEWQPVFYPVTNQQYAEQIPREWNTKDAFSGYCGLVTRFDVDSNYLTKFPIHHVGGAIHDELWVPSEELLEFNAHIIHEIEVINGFFGDLFSFKKHGLVQPYYLQFTKD